MSKSLGNLYTVQDLLDKNIDPLALRYLFLQTHYRKEMNFTFESLSAAAQALKRLRASISKLQISNNKQTLNLESQKAKEYQDQFKSALADDLNTAQALAVVWEVVKDEVLSDDEKVALMLDFDRVLGLELEATSDERRAAVPAEIQALLETRVQLRKAGDYAQADALRDKIIALGYEVSDK